MIGQDQRLVAVEPAERGERSCDSQQVRDSLLHPFRLLQKQSHRLRSPRSPIPKYSENWFCSSSSADPNNESVKPQRSHSWSSAMKVRDCANPVRNSPSLITCSISSYIPSQA